MSVRLLSGLQRENPGVPAEEALLANFVCVHCIP